MQLYKISFPGKTNKIYIGITKGLAVNRLKSHCSSKRKTKIYYAIKKYGSPLLTIIANIDNWDLLCLAEIEAIEKYNSKHPNGYNLTDGGEGANGHSVSREAREIISQKGKERFLNKDELIKNSERMKEYASRPGVKERMSASGREWHRNNPEARINQSSKIKEYFKSNPEKEAIRSNKIKNYWSCPFNRSKQMLSQSTGWAIKNKIPFSEINK